jgi:hypothetical protein
VVSFALLSIARRAAEIKLRLTIDAAENQADAGAGEGGLRISRGHSRDDIFAKRRLSNGRKPGSRSR